MWSFEAKPWIMKKERNVQAVKSVEAEKQDQYGRIQ